METGRGAKQDIVITQGKTFRRVLRLGGEPHVYKAITAITKAAPVRLTVTGHGLRDGWPVAVVSVKGMTQLNSELDETTLLPKPSGYRPATVIDPNTIEFNAVNSSDFTTYVSGGYLQFYTPTDLAGAIVRLTVRDKIGGTALVELDSASLGGIEVDNTAKTITVVIDSEFTASLLKSGVYDSEIEFTDGTVLPLNYGRAKLEREVTT